MTSRNEDVIAYLEQRRERRKETAVRIATFVVFAIVTLALLWLATRTFFHFTGIGARTTLSISPQGSGSLNVTTTKTPVSILP